MGSELGPEKGLYFSTDISGGPDAMATGGSPEEMAEYLASLERGRGAPERYESGRALESTLARHHSLETLQTVVRLLQLANERDETGGELVVDYDIGRQAGILRDRRLAIGMTMDELETAELVKPLDKETKEALINMGDIRKMLEDLPEGVDIDSLFGTPVIGGYGFRTISVPTEQLDTFEKDEKDKKVNKRYRKTTQEVTFYDTKEKRDKFSEGCWGLEKELYVRNLIHKNWGRYHFFREAVTKLVEMYFGPVPSTEGVAHILNLPFREKETHKAVSGAEFRNFGDKIEMGMRLYYINALCQKPERFLKLIRTPGWNNFVFPNVEGQDKGELIREWVGRSGEWILEQEPYEDPGMPGQFDKSGLGTVRSRETLKKENGNYPRDVENEKGERRDFTEIDRQKLEAGGWEEKEDGKIIREYIEKKDARGRLTRGNIFAESKTKRNKDLHEAIREFLGGGEKASKVDQEAAAAAQGLAYKLFKLWMIADNEGYEIYKDPKKSPDELGMFKGKELQFENGPASSDFSKLTYPSFYNLKNKRKHTEAPVSRDYGPEGSFGKIPRFCTDFLRIISTKVEVPAEEAIDGYITQELSFNEQWWGYPEDTEENLPRVEAKRLGELPWMEIELEKVEEKDAEILGLPTRGISGEALQLHYLTAFMAGRSRVDNGSYAITLQTDLGDLKFLEDPSFWLKFSKALGVGIKEGTIVNGEFRGKSGLKEERKEYIQYIFDTYWEGIASTVDYEEAYDTLVPAGRGLTRDKQITRVEKIRRIAAKAGVKLKAIPPSHKTPVL